MCFLSTTNIQIEHDAKITFGNTNFRVEKVHERYYKLIPVDDKDWDPKSMSVGEKITLSEESIKTFLVAKHVYDQHIQSAEKLVLDLVQVLRKEHPTITVHDVYQLIENWEAS